MKPITPDQLAALRFPVVAAPKRPMLTQFSAIIGALSFIFGIGIMLGLIYLGLFNYLDALFSRGILLMEETRHKTIFVGLLVALAFFGYAYYSIREKKKLKPGALYRKIGEFTLNETGCEINKGEQDIKSWKWYEINRLDCFYGMGISTQTSNQENVFDSIDVIRLRIRSHGQETDEYILNSELGVDEYGMLYHALYAIKRLSLQNHQKIQFWGQF